jgi:proline dehydrogenase
MTKAAATKAELQEKISSATLDSLLEAIEHDPIILNVAKELLKEVVKDAVELENKKEKPSLQEVIEHINGQVWSDLFAKSALRTVELIKAVH